MHPAGPQTPALDPAARRQRGHSLARPPTRCHSLSVDCAQAPPGALGTGSLLAAQTRGRERSDERAECGAACGPGLKGALGRALATGRAREAGSEQPSVSRPPLERPRLRRGLAAGPRVRRPRLARVWPGAASERSALRTRTSTLLRRCLRGLLRPGGAPHFMEVDPRFKGSWNGLTSRKERVGGRRAGTKAQDPHGDCAAATHGAGLGQAPGPPAPRLPFRAVGARLAGLSGRPTRPHGDSCSLAHWPAQRRLRLALGVPGAAARNHTSRRDTRQGTVAGPATALPGAASQQPG